MSDKPISVGDLVQIIYDCCDGALLGDIGTVTRIDQKGVRCMLCKFESDGASAAVELRMGWDKLPLSWLKRIPPLDELEGERRDEEVTA